MTKDTIAETMALKALLSETSDQQILVEMLGFVADRLMALDLDQLCGASAHERRAERVNQRNGYRERSTYTSTGNPGRKRRCSDTEASKGVVLSGVSGTTLGLGERDDGRDPGGLHPRGLHPLG